MTTIFMPPLEQRLWLLLEPPVVDMGLRLARIRLTGGQRPTLQIMIEPVTATRGVFDSVVIEQCEAVSRAAAALLDVEDPISSAYHLEVSSTGPERPLVKAQDFTAYAGATVKVDMLSSVLGVGSPNGSRRFRGVLGGLTEEGDSLLLTLEDGNVLSLPLQDVKSAQVVLTEDEWAAFMKSAGQKQAEESDNAPALNA